MKKIGVLFLVMLFASTLVFAQTDKGAQVQSRVELLNQTVFGTKNATTLDGLLAIELTYGHSGGAIENRAEALKNATTNGNTYANMKMDGFSVFFAGKSAIVRYVLEVDQTNTAGTVHLKLGMLQVWVKQQKQWKLTARQAVKLPQP